MEKSIRSRAWRAGLLLVAALGSSACSVETTVSVGATTAPQVQHLYVTATQVWLSTSATAAPTGSDWVGSELATPISIDLASLNAGTLSSLLSSVKAGAGTYKQVRIVLADSADPLTTAAQSAGLTWNAQVQYLDAQGNSATLPLELPSPTSQLVIPTNLVLSGGGAGVLMNTAASTTDTTTAAAANGATTTTVAVDLDTVRKWVLFKFDDQTGALLSPSMSVKDVKNAGAISGSVDLSSVAASVLTGPQGIVVTAEAPSADGTRFEAVKSVALQSGGVFTLYPLPVGVSGTSDYDLVIHGPGIRTVIVSQVPVSSGDAESATVVQSSALRISSARDYTVNAAANSAALPGGSQVGFYQTIPGSTAPHLIEFAMLDPFNGGLTSIWFLSSDAIDYGTYNSGGDIVISTSAPDEGIGTYRIGADAPLRVSSSLSTIISAPNVLISAVQPLFLPPLNPTTNAAVSGTLTGSAAGRFDRGFLMVSRGGQLIEAVDLRNALSTVSTSIPFTVSGLPAAVDSARYDVAVRLWNSRDPAGTLTRAAATTQADLTTGSAASISIAVP